MIKVEKTKLDGVLLIKPDTFEDFRGSYTETYNLELYKQAGIIADFVQDDYSTSKMNVLRGLHGDSDTWKLVDCMLGEIYFLVLNYDKKSAQFGLWQSFNLSEKNRWQVLVPPKFANGHLALSDKIIFHYKQSTYYRANVQFTVKYDDSRFNIDWPMKTPLLSERDKLSKAI